MTESNLCPECGKELAVDAPAGLCPECLLRQGMRSELDSRSAEIATALAGFVPPTPEELSEKFPQLEILGFVGKGGMGAVYKARQPNLDRVVALKILPPEVARDPAFAERFLREARALARLSHPNVVAVYDFGEADGLYYFMMEYVDGANLRQTIRVGKLSPNEALAIVPQICEALQFAHDAGVVHRDIKPENILIDQKGRVKIADFGLAKIISGEDATSPERPFTLTGTHQVMGTIHYMAPEQVEGTHAVDHRADIYSLGVVFYEMLTGELPIGRFAAPSEKVQMDVRLDEVVLRSLEKEPEKRYQRAGDVKTEVESITRMAPQVVKNAFGSEYRSKATLFGWPLVHIATGIDPATGKKRVARGWIAIGDIAIGAVAIGGMAFGGLVFSGVGVGLVTLAGLSVGLFAAIGGVAVGSFAFGGVAIGGIAVGGAAFGLFSFGGVASGLHSMGGNAAGPQAKDFFPPWVASWPRWLTGIAIVVPLTMALISGITWLVLRSSGDEETETDDAGRDESLEKAETDALMKRKRSPVLVTLISVLVLMGVVVCVPVVLWVFSEQQDPAMVPRELPASSRQRVDAVMGSAVPKQERSMKLKMTEDGPNITAMFERAMKLDGDQVEQVNGAIEEVYAEYLKLLKEHVEESENAAGHRVVKVVPFGDEITKLEESLWEKLDPMLDVEQQNLLRLNLPLQPKKVWSGKYMGKTYDGRGIFGYGGAEFKIELWRVGEWYYWKVRDPAVWLRGGVPLQGPGRAPELPEAFRLWWEEEKVEESKSQKVE